LGPTGVVATFGIGHSQFVFDGLKPYAIVGKPVGSDVFFEGLEFGFGFVEQGLGYAFVHVESQYFAQAFHLDFVGEGVSVFEYVEGLFGTELVLDFGIPHGMVDGGAMEVIDDEGGGLAGSHFF